MAAGVSAATGEATVRTARCWPTAGLVALTVILTFESFRVLFPHLYGLKEREGLMTVLIAFLAVAAAPFLGPLLARLLKPHRAMALSALLLGAWRLVVQFLDPIAVVTAIAGAILSLVTLTLVLSAPLPGGPGTRAAGLLGGFALDAVILGAFVSWEPAWQDGVAAAVVGATAVTGRVGDDASDRQYRAVLDFNTAALPDNAVITAVTLKVKKQKIYGSNPFDSLGSLTVDMRTGFFHDIQALEKYDFQAAGSRGNVARFIKTASAGWYRAPLRAQNNGLVNLTGTTQFRLRFGTDDNDNGVADYLSFYTGNAAEADRPQLIITYWVP